jgi:hypothetical protein
MPIARAGVVMGPKINISRALNISLVGVYAAVSICQFSPLWLQPLQHLPRSLVLIWGSTVMLKMLFGRGEARTIV